jgi:hypothetical protein
MENLLRVFEGNGLTIIMRAFDLTANIYNYLEDDDQPQPKRGR